MPSPHVAEHEPQLVQPPFIAQGLMSHLRMLLPWHGAPSFWGGGRSHARVCVPSPQLAEHVLQDPHCPLTFKIHGCSLQVRFSTRALAPFEVVQLRPPKCGRGASQRRRSVPPPHAALQALQSPHRPSTGHGFIAHAFCVSPSHLRPPCAGTGLLHLRTRTAPMSDPPQVWEHEPHAPHFPSTGHGGRPKHHWRYGPLHGFPPPRGRGDEHVRVCVAAPHVCSHAPHSVHPPSTRSPLFVAVGRPLAPTRNQDMSPVGSVAAEGAGVGALHASNLHCGRTQHARWQCLYSAVPGLQNCARTCAPCSTSRIALVRSAHRCFAFTLPQLRQVAALAALAASCFALLWQRPHTRAHFIHSGFCPLQKACRTRLPVRGCLMASRGS